MEERQNEGHGLIPKNELAFKYFPNAKSKNVATWSLTRWIKRCKALSSALAADGYNVREKSYTPRQVELIKKYLGDP